MTWGRGRRRNTGGLDKGDSGGGDLQQALSYAFKLLGYRQRSRQELTRRLLLKGFSSEVSDEAISRLTDYGYLDDRVTASSLRHNAEKGKMLGLSGARQYLRTMGISRNDTDEALEGYDEIVSATRLAEKKMHAIEGIHAAEARKKLSGYLRRRGFSYETIKKTMDAFIKEEK